MCISAILSIKSPRHFSDVNYVLGESQGIISWTYDDLVTSDFPVSCGNFEIVFTHEYNAAVTGIDTSVFTLDQSSKQLSYQSSDPNKAGEYILHYFVQLVCPNGSKVNSMNGVPFKVVVIDPCTSSAGLAVTMNVLSNPPTYLYTGTSITNSMSTIFASSDASRCPITAYECELIDSISSALSPCE